MKKLFLLETFDNFANEGLGNVLKEFDAFDKEFVGVYEDFSPKRF